MHQKKPKQTNKNLKKELSRIDCPAISREMAHKRMAGALLGSRQLSVNGLVHRETSQEKQI